MDDQNGGLTEQRIDLSGGSARRNWISATTSFNVSAMKRLVWIPGLLLAIPSVVFAAEAAKRPGPTMGEVIAASQPQDWRALDPENTLYLELAGGRVVIELAPAFAPRHVANVQALAREHYYDGLAIVRVQDNYVVQWADPNAEKPDLARKVQHAQRTLPAEFERAIDSKVPFTRLPDGDVYAPEVGFSEGFPVARDPRSGRMWLVHSYGMAGAGRDTAADSGGGTELYVVIGQAPRQLDRNVTLLGRVVQGMELLTALPRGKGAMGFYERAEQRVPIRTVRVAADLPEAERTPLEVMRTDTPRFQELIESRRNRTEEWFKVPAGRIELSNVPIPVRSVPAVRVEVDTNRARIPFLSWDTEGGDRAESNLLRPGEGVFLRIGKHQTWTSSASLSPQVVRDTAGHHELNLAVAPNANLRWVIDVAADRFTQSFVATGQGWNDIDQLELCFPFDPRTTPVTVLPKDWNSDGRLSLPAIISAPDFGQMLVTPDGEASVKARLEGSRARHTVDFVVELPKLESGQTCTLSFSPVRLPAPAGLKDEGLWRLARRGWFGALQCSAAWGDPGHAFSAPAGMLANNVISDPASCSIWFYADQAFWTPELAPGISSLALVRRTLDWWLDHKVLPSGEMICYWDKAHFLDANAGPLIAAWDYVDASGDTVWLTQRIERLEFIADYLVRRDIDGDGLVEAVQTGNSGTLREPGRSCAWWDALNCGYKDSYSNALIYRAWRCLADLEAKLHRSSPQARYTQRADRLKAAYFKTLFNPQTGWLAWWKSKDGQLHDYASPVVNGLAIEYGLVDAQQGHNVLGRLRQKMRDAGFTHFELGVPPMLVPVRRSDYLLPDGLGCPHREDGTDTFGYYMNGAITAGQVLHYLAAQYVVGDEREADPILRAMLERQMRGGFQNGAVNAYPRGIDWTTWTGQPAGYEGYLADSFRFLQAVLLREPQLRSRLYRPLMSP
jgi:peptidylprolyl isomerase